MVGRIMGHFGRRGLSVVLYSLMWIFIGFSRLMGEYDPFPPDAAMGLHNWLEPQVRGWIWIATAVIAVSATTFGPAHKRWPYAVAFLALVTVPLINVWAYFWSGLMFVVPGAPGGLQSSVIAFFIWSGIFTKVLVDAGWDEDVREEKET